MDNISVWLSQNALDWGITITLALAIFIIGKFFARLIANLLEKAMQRGGTIVNTSALPTRRVELVFGIGYDDDIGQARDIIMGILKADERVLEDPAPTVVVSELAASSVNLSVRPWAKSEDL